MSPKEYQIDFIKAADVANSDFYFRMMVALNDLLNEKQLSGTIAKSGFDKYAEIGLDSYTNRLVLSHLSESCNTFVEKIKEQKNPTAKALYLEIQSDQQSFARFEALAREIFELDADGAITKRIEADGTHHTLKKQYEQLKSVRNQIGFHMDPVPFQNALQALKAEYMQKPPVSHIGFIVDATTQEIRFPIADTVASAASMQQAGIGLTKLIDGQNAEYVAFRDYTGHLSELLISYLATAVRNWLRLKQLII